MCLTEDGGGHGMIEKCVCLTEDGGGHGASEGEEQEVAGAESGGGRRRGRGRAAHQRRHPTVLRQQDRGAAGDQ